MPKIAHITFACTDPDELADFWATALDGDRTAPPVETSDVIVERANRADLLFRAAPKGTERDLPIHLDLAVDDREAAVDRLCDHGASVRETKTEEFEDFTATWTILEDPEGNGFCVTAY